LNTTTQINYPSFEQLTHQFGPYLGTLIFFIIIILILQSYWFNRTLNGKNKEIERGVKRVSELEATMQKLINQLRSIPKK
jgi:hypothetical protein